MQTGVAHPSALAVGDDRVVIIAGDGGLRRVDAGSHVSHAIASTQDLGGFLTLAVRNRAIVGVQRIGGAFTIARLTLDASGTRATSWSPLATAADPLVGTLAGDTFYYLSGRTILKVTSR